MPSAESSASSKTSYHLPLTTALPQFQEQTLSFHKNIPSRHTDTKISLRTLDTFYLDRCTLSFITIILLWVTTGCVFTCFYVKQGNILCIVLMFCTKRLDYNYMFSHFSHSTMRLSCNLYYDVCFTSSSASLFRSAISEVSFLPSK